MATVGNIEVGTVQAFRNDVPAPIKIVYRTLMGMVAIWAIVAPQFPEIPEHLAHVIDRVCLIGLPVFYAVCQAFGIQKPE